jgi:uncharacterized membrane protein YcjF (UPF0283 family)
MAIWNPFRRMRGTKPTESHTGPASPSNPAAPTQPTTGGEPTGANARPKPFWGWTQQNADAANPEAAVAGTTTAAYASSSQDVAPPTPAEPLHTDNNARAAAEQALAENGLSDQGKPAAATETPAESHANTENEITTPKLNKREGFFDSLLEVAHEDARRSTSFFYNQPAEHGLRAGIVEQDIEHYEHFLQQEELSKRLWQLLQISRQRYDQTETQRQHTAAERRSLEDQHIALEGHLAATRTELQALQRPEHPLQRARTFAQLQYDDLLGHYQDCLRIVKESAGKFNLLQITLYLLGAFVFGFGEFLVSSKLVVDSAIVEESEASLFGISIAFFSLMLKPIYDFFVEGNIESGDKRFTKWAFWVMTCVFLICIIALNLYRMKEKPIDNIDNNSEEYDWFMFTAYLTMSLVFAIGGTILFSQSLPQLYQWWRNRRARVELSLRPRPLWRKWLMSAGDPVALRLEEFNAQLVEKESAVAQANQRLEMQLAFDTQALQTLLERLRLLPADAELKAELLHLLELYEARLAAYRQSCADTDLHAYRHSVALGQAVRRWLQALRNDSNTDPDHKAFTAENDLFLRLLRKGMPERPDYYGSYNRGGSPGGPNGNWTGWTMNQRVARQSQRPYEMLREFFLDRYLTNEN